MRYLNILLAGIVTAAPTFGKDHLAVPAHNTDFSIGVEALYWRVYEEGTTYGMFRTQPRVTIPLADNQMLELQPDYGWGFRLVTGVCSQCQPYSAELEWIHFRDVSTARAVKSAEFNSLDVISVFRKFNFLPCDAINIRQVDRYNRVSLRLYKQFCSGACGRISAYLGGGWRGIFVNDHITYEGSNAESLDTVLQASLGAISVGFSARAQLGCGLGVKMRLGGFVAAGDLFYKAKAIGAGFSGPVGTDIAISPTSTHCLPGIEADGAITFARECGCVCIEGRLGFRFDYYFGIERRDSFSSELGPTSAAHLGYGGPYIGASFTY